MSCQGNRLLPFARTWSDWRYEYFAYTATNFMLSQTFRLCLKTSRCQYLVLSTKLLGQKNHPIPSQGSQSWIIGIVERGEREAKVIDKPRIIEVGVQYQLNETTLILYVDSVMIFKKSKILAEIGSMAGAKQGEGRGALVTSNQDVCL